MIWNSVLEMSKTNNLRWYKKQPINEVGWILDYILMKNFSWKHCFSLQKFSVVQVKQYWYSQGLSDIVYSLFVRLIWLNVCDNYYLNPFNYGLPLVLWLIYCLWGEIPSESISKTPPVIKKFNIYFVWCITCLVICLINIWTPIFISIVCIGYQPPQKTPPLLFCEAPF